MQQQGPVKTEMLVANTIFSFLKDIYSKKHIIYSLALRDIKQKTQGSYLGILWIFIQPLLFIGILYTIFTIGFRQGTSTEIPFSIYLVCGMVAWLYFAENLASSANILRSYSYLVKKIDFRLSLLPVVQLLGNLAAHGFLLLVAIGLAWINGFPPGLHTIQLIYYLFAMMLLLVGIAWIVSSTNLFVSDVGKLVSVLVQFGFWLTPVFWHLEFVPEKYHWIIKLNPMHYIVTGYRDSITGNAVFWNYPEETAYYWFIVMTIMATGIFVYRRLRPHFAEVV